MATLEEGSGVDGEEEAAAAERGETVRISWRT